ncbi:MAG TPA: SDR family oxidoreductase [Rhodothermales bacterium]|nr:SDR family oxidoreductase [Rhodothermales bacterium]
MARVLVAGASGHLGRYVVSGLQEAGHVVRGLSRGASSSGADEHVRADLTQPETLLGVCDGIDAVISCAGAPLTPVPGHRTSFAEIDFHGNRNLLDQAQLVGVKKFVYVSPFGGPNMMRTEYARAHEYFVLALEDSGLPYTVVRPTGLFYMFLNFLHLAKENKAFVIGNGQARTNPIHEADAAKLCIEALDYKGTDIPAGGPDTFTREQIVELAFDTVDRSPQFVQHWKRHWMRQFMPQFLNAGPDIKHLPPFLFTTASKVARPFHGRFAAMLDFAAEVSTTDAIAPVRGSLRLEDYYKQHAGRMVKSNWWSGV